MNNDKLLWLDLETTGSDERYDCIIEIGCVLTNSNLSPLYDDEEEPSASWVVCPTDEGLGRMLRNDVVRTMHEENGLLQEVLENHPDPIDKITPRVIAWLETYGARQDTVVICGSGVSHFDRRFIRRFMPQLDRYCRHWHLDTGVIRRAHEFWLGVPGPNMNPGKTHRALDDAKCHLLEARTYQRMWQASGLAKLVYPELTPEQARGDFYAIWQQDA